MRKQIEGYEGLYQIDINGNVYSKPRQGTRGGLVRLIIDEYYEVVLCKNSICKRFLLHRLIAKAFIENPYFKPQVNHKDGNKFNNKIENLEWCNNSENQLHAYKSGLSKPSKGSANGRSKLTESIVAEIRKTANEKGRHYGRKELAKKFNVSECTIKEIVNKRRNTWADVC